MAEKLKVSYISNDSEITLFWEKPSGAVNFIYEAFVDEKKVWSGNRTHCTIKELKGRSEI